jgi:hypothetical protein
MYWTLSRSLGFDVKREREDYHPFLTEKIFIIISWGKRRQNIYSWEKGLHLITVTNLRNVSKKTVVSQLQIRYRSLGRWSWKHWLVTWILMLQRCLTWKHCTHDPSMNHTFMFTEPPFRELLQSGLSRQLTCWRDLAPTWTTGFWPVFFSDNILICSVLYVYKSLF